MVLFSNVPDVNIQPTFTRTLVDRGPARRGDGLLLALSGGPDSTALAHLSASIREEWAFDLRALHVNYRLRGGESDEDERFVRGLCSDLGVPLAVRSAHPLEIRRRESLQMAARRIRYLYLEEERARTEADWIVTAHTRDDRVETLLINLLRGAGPRGLGSIPFRRGRVIRPLLEVSRGEIEAFLAARALPFRVDRSNLETGFDRNKIRLELLPFAETLLGRRVGDSIARTADILAEAESFIEAEAARWVLEHARVEEASASLLASDLAGIPRALAREVVRTLVRGSGDPFASMSLERVDRVLRIAGAPGSGRALLPGNREARREGDRVRFGLVSASPAPFHAALPVPGDAALPDGRRLVSRLIPSAGAPENVLHGEEKASLDWDRVRPPLVVRSRRPGDRFRPLGSPGERKLQDLLVDRKVPRTERDGVPILADEEGILWVAGVAIAERARVAASTRTILEVAFLGA